MFVCKFFVLVQAQAQANYVAGFPYPSRSPLLSVLHAASGLIWRRCVCARAGRLSQEFVSF